MNKIVYSRKPIVILLAIIGFLYLYGRFGFVERNDQLTTGEPLAIFALYVLFSLGVLLIHPYTLKIWKWFAGMGGILFIMLIFSAKVTCGFFCIFPVRSEMADILGLGFLLITLLITIISAIIQHFKT